MSSMLAKLAQAIRAIVGYDPKVNRALTAQAIRDAILARRGIGYMLPDQLNAGGYSGLAGQTQLPQGFAHLAEGYASDEVVKKILDAEKNAPKDIEEVLNMGIGDKAMAITGLEDCATGKDVEIINTPEFKPPADWDDENTPSADNPIRWDLGFRYEVPTSPPTFGETAEQAAMAAPANLGVGWAFDHYIDPASIGSTAAFAANYQGPGGLSSNMPIEKVPCIVGVDSFCPATHATPDWPADGKMQLARGADGKFRYSEKEPAADIISDFTDNQHTELDLCFADGSGRKANITTTYDGGYMVFEQDPDTGERIGRGQVFNADNVLERHIQPEEAEFYEATSTF